MFFVQKEEAQMSATIQLTSMHSVAVAKKSINQKSHPVSV